MGNRSGASAVEFALVGPFLILLLFGVIAFSTIMTVSSAVQQLVAEAARATIGGMSDSERDQLARASVSANATAYPLLDAAKITVSTSALGQTPPTFMVTVSYDMSAMFVYKLTGLLPLPSGKTVLRSAVVQRWGY